MFVSCCACWSLSCACWSFSCACWSLVNGFHPCLIRIELRLSVAPSSYPPSQMACCPSRYQGNQSICSRNFSSMIVSAWLSFSRLLKVGVQPAALFSWKNSCNTGIVWVHVVWVIVQWLLMCRMSGAGLDDDVAVLLYMLTYFIMITSWIWHKLLSAELKQHVSVLQVAQTRKEMLGLFLNSYCRRFLHVNLGHVSESSRFEKPWRATQVFPIRNFLMLPT